MLFCVFSMTEPACEFCTNQGEEDLLFSVDIKDIKKKTTVLHVKGFYTNDKLN